MNNNYFESYNKRTHVIGRISSAIALVMLVGAPFLIGRMLGAMPDIGAVGNLANVVKPHHLQRCRDAGRGAQILELAIERGRR